MANHTYLVPKDLCFFAPAEAGSVWDDSENGILKRICEEAKSDEDVYEARLIIRSRYLGRLSALPDKGGA